MGKTTQDNFHPMAGHVCAGQQVAMNNGDTLTITPVMKGWQLVDQLGRKHSISTDSAHVIACLIFSYPNEDIGG